MQGYRAFSRNDELLVPFRTWRNNITAQLAGYVHWKLPGVRVPGLGDASGMFPIDNNADSLGLDKRRIALYDAHIADRGGSWKLGDILPRTVQVGEIAGRLSEEGAALLDPGGALRPGIPLAPPEDDAATGMAATNSVRVRTGSISAGTSVFAMLVMEKWPERVHKEIDLVTTPDRELVGTANSK